MKYTVLLLMAVLLALAGGCRKRDVRTVTVHVPAMHNEACAERVVRSLYDLIGVEGPKTEVDFQNRKVIVTYDSMVLSLKNIQFAIAGVGFAADEIPANAKAVAALPPECRE